MIIGVDVDEVVCGLHRPWLDWINRSFDVEVGAFHQWEVDKQIPEVGKAVYNFLRPRIYADDIVDVLPGTHPALATIRKNHFIIFVTSCPNGTEEAKYDWLLRHDIMRPGFGDLFLSTSDKSEAEVDILVDDHAANIEGFKGLGVLVTRSHNRTSRHPLRVSSLMEFASLL